MIKRIMDVLGGAFGLTVASPVIVPVMVAVWAQDRHSPFYLGTRVGRHGTDFRMVKLRSMIVGAHKTGVDSTGANDRRITRLGHFIRRFKLDELPQLWNVLRGEMSLVGPRPNVSSGVALYTNVEKHLLDVPPGITDFASIVFADEGEILKDSADPDLDYDRLIRPWKSRLGLFYVDHQSVWTDLRLLVLTVANSVSRERALEGVAALLEELGADPELVQAARRMEPLRPHPPPGSDVIPTSVAPS